MFKNMNPAALGIRATLSEVVELALLGDFAGIEASMPEIAALAEGQSLRYTESIFESAQLKIGTWRLPVNWQDDDETFESDLKRLAGHAEHAQRFGAFQTTTTVAPASEDLPFRENFESHCERLRRVADVLASYDCRLGLAFNGRAKARAGKPHEFIHTFEALVQLVSGVGAANAGVVVDSFHLYASGGSIEEIGKLKPEQVVTAIVNDVAEGVAVEELTEEDRLLPQAAGVIDAAAVLKTLQEIGYEGPVTPEPSSRTARQLSREQSARKAGAVMQELWVALGLASDEQEPQEAAATGAQNASP